MSETTVTNVTSGGRSGIGAAPLTVSVLNFDTSLGCDSATFQPCSERALSSLKFLIDAYRTHYPINQAIPKNEPVLIGGYLEDSFLGGGVSSPFISQISSSSSQPYQAQYFSTFNSAEQLLDAVHTWNLLGGLDVTKQSLSFFRQFDPDVRLGTYRTGSATFDRLIDGIMTWAENTILLVSKHTPSDYVLPLSINGTSGEPYGPRGALRSLVAALTARDVYNGLIQPSWAPGSDYKTHAELAGRMICGSEELV
jgi:glucoamylase